MDLRFLNHNLFESKELLLFLRIKQENKEKLAKYLKETQGLTIDSTSIFDMQIKRLHEYKRQQMNILYVIDKYLRIKQGEIWKRYL